MAGAQHSAAVVKYCLLLLGVYFCFHMLDDQRKRTSEGREISLKILCQSLQKVSETSTVPLLTKNGITCVVFLIIDDYRCLRPSPVKRPIM